MMFKVADFHVRQQLRLLDCGEYVFCSLSTIEPLSRTARSWQAVSSGARLCNLR